MTCLRCLTSRACLAVAAAVALAGCHGQTRRPASRLVYADLHVLVKRHPGWNGVALYDAMLVQLGRSVQQAEEGLNAPLPAVGLAAINGLAMPGGAYALPQSTLAQQQLSLARLSRTQIARLEQRRAQIRASEIVAEARVWRRDARLRYRQDAVSALARYQEGYVDAISQNDTRRLNLTLQVQALQNDIAHWTLAAPPTPLLDGDRQQLAADQGKLLELKSEQAAAIAALGARREEDLRLAEEAGDRYVMDQQAALTNTLTEADNSAIAKQQALLSQQTSAMMVRERQLVAGAVPLTGTLGAVTLTPETRSHPPPSGLREAEARLVRQRDRWVRNIYEDTQAAAEDAARQRGWTVTFDPIRRGEPDRTSELAAILASHTWKS